MEAGTGATDSTPKEDVKPAVKENIAPASVSAPAAAAAPAAATIPATAPAQVEVNPPPVDEYEDFPDPDEDDLDDLDDMLDDFSSVRLEPKKSAEPPRSVQTEPANAPPPASVPAATAAPGVANEPALDEAFSSDDFAKQLEAGMADLLGQLDSNPEMQKEFDDMFRQISAAAAEEEKASGPSQDKGKDKAPPTSADDASFQETIRKTMERMQASGDQATAAAASGASDDFMSELLKQMGTGDPNAPGSEEDFSKMLMNMMEQLTNKEILYEPMRELRDKFPKWLADNRDTAPKEDMARFDEQYRLVQELVAKFEEPTYSDSNPADREIIVDRMQKMQAQGSPPADLVGDLPSAQDALDMPDESCNPQ